MTPAIREALNAESERMQVIRNVMLPHVNIDKYKKQFANAYTAEDLLPQNMMKVIWRPGWEADVPKHGLRPQSPGNLIGYCCASSVSACRNAVFTSAGIECQPRPILIACKILVDTIYLWSSGENLIGCSRLP